ncbi:hypothetical protein HDU99_003819 [Rhizoclosmatium hyalinum]|nr:hypothetical protein HDU99_003819 [Rhizoclosmatium hyalinum]
MEAVHQLVANGPIETLKTLLFAYTILKYARYFVAYLRVKGIYGTVSAFIKFVSQRAITLIRRFVPGADKKIAAEVGKSVDSLQKKIVGNVADNLKTHALPSKGTPPAAVLSELKRFKGRESIDWKAGKVSGAIYHGGEEVNKLITEAFGMFTIANPLHPELFPGIRQMEAEVISMVLRMYNAPGSACGSMTSGGTESLLMGIFSLMARVDAQVFLYTAIKTYRDMAKELRGVTEPEM